MMRALTALALALLPFTAFAQTLTIHTDKPGAKIDRNIFGQFAEHLGNGIYGGVWVGPDSSIPNTRGIRNDVVAALKALRVPNVRWPGGCYADRYYWRDGIGRAGQRVSRVNMWGRVIDPNSFGTHEFMDFVEQIGSEAYLSVNIGGGTPKEAADWLEYLTADQPTSLAKERKANGRDKPWKVKYLGLGNEAWGCGGGYSAEGYANEMARYAIAAANLNPAQMGKAPFVPAPDPMLRIAAGPDSGEPEYTEAIMQRWKSRKPYAWNIEGLSLHYYTFGKEGIFQSPARGFGEGDYAILLKNAYQMDAHIARHSAIMDKHDPEKKLALAVDEWGVWLKPIAGTEMMFLRQESSLRDGIAAAIHLNIFARHADRVRMANVAQMANVLQAMIMTDGAKMHLTPSYHVFRMYVPFHDATFVPITLDAGTYTSGDVSLPRLDAMAARGKDGQLWLAVAHLDPNAPVDVALAGHSAAVGETLTAAKVDSVNSFAQPDAVKPIPFRAIANNRRLTLRLPAGSITVVKLVEGSLK
jgi:alpha-L-arabinofuranosidase